MKYNMNTMGEQVLNAAIIFDGASQAKPSKKAAKGLHLPNKSNITIQVKPIQIDGFPKVAQVAAHP